MPGQMQAGGTDAYDVWRRTRGGGCEQGEENSACSLFSSLSCTHDQCGAPR
jgi:hypothetical protein